MPMNSIKSSLRFLLLNCRKIASSMIKSILMISPRIAWFAKRCVTICGRSGFLSGLTIGSLIGIMIKIVFESYCLFSFPIIFLGLFGLVDDIGRLISKRN